MVDRHMPIRRHRKYVTDGDLDALLAHYKAGTTIDPSGTMTFDDHRLDELERILPDAFDADPSLTPQQVSRILTRALRDSRKGSAYSVDDIVARARVAAQDLLSHSPKSYAMWTKFRAVQMPFHDGFELEWSDVRIRSEHTLPDHMHLEEYLISGHGYVHPSEPEHYGFLVMECSTRNREEAAARMFEAQQLFYALFNVYERGFFTLFHSRMAPEGKLLSGPYHFLYAEGQFVGQDTVWYDPDYDEEDWTSLPLSMEQVLPRLKPALRALEVLAAHPLRNVIIKVLHLLQDGMAARTYSYRLLRFWSALEQLYGEPGSGQMDYKQIIRRASFAEDDKVLSRWKLSHISRHRNDYVHAGNDAGEIYTMCQYLRHLLLRHVNYLLYNAEGLSRLADWHRIVDLPADEGELQRLEQAIARRMKIIGQGKVPENSES